MESKYVLRSAGAVATLVAFLVGENVTPWITGEFEGHHLPVHGVQYGALIGGTVTGSGATTAGSLAIISVMGTIPDAVIEAAYDPNSGREQSPSGAVENAKRTGAKFFPLGGVRDQPT